MKCAGKQYQNAQMCVFMTNSKQLKNIKNYKVTNPKQQRELTTLHWGPALKQFQGLVLKPLAVISNSKPLSLCVPNS